MITLRRAELRDLATIARHRAQMFVDMGSLPAASAPELAARTMDYLRDALPTGRYLGWLAVASAEPATIAGGAGVLVRDVLPFPNATPAGVVVARGRQALVMNVYTEPAWRRQGVARRLMEAVLAWAREAEVESLVLHASDEGRALYEQLGFAATNEMRLVGRSRGAEPRFVFRDAAAGDDDAIRRVVDAVLREHGLPFDPAGMDADLEGVAAQYHGRGGLFRVLTDETGRIVGCGGVFPLNAEEAQLRKMYLAPAARGQGLGRRLLEELLAHARAGGFRRVVLETESRLKDAGALYRRFGFVEVPHLHPSPRCDTTMVLRLE